MKNNVLNPWLIRLLRQLIPNIGTVLVVAALLFFNNVRAASLTTGTSPSTISYQGTLITASGTPVNASVGITFRLYNVQAGGTALWTEAHTGTNVVPVANGLFNVLLGSITSIPSTVWDNTTVYLGVQVAGDSAELSPREMVSAVPMAMMTSKITIPDGSVTTSKIANGAVTSFKFAPTVIASRLISSEHDDVAVTSSLTWVDMPLSLSFNLPSTSQVLVNLSCQARNDVVDSGTGMQIMDGTNRIGNIGRYDVSDGGRIGMIFVQDIVSLSPGNHTLQAQFVSYAAGTSHLRQCLFYAMLMGQ